MKQESFNHNWVFYKEGSSQRQQINLPHDAMLFEKREQANPSSGACACFEGGIYYYEKEITAPAEWSGKAVQLYFEGVYQKAQVYLNGREIGGCAYGYTGFLVELDGLNIGEKNLLCVKVDNSRMPNSRWYTGSGIYRPVTLLTGGKKRIRHKGVQIETLTYAPARIRVTTDALGASDEELIIEIWKDGTIVAEGKGAVAELDIPEAKLWSDEEPALYECRVRLCENGQTIDEEQETFGIRYLEYSSKGFLVNGRETLLRGGCVHHDNGILGAKSYAKSEWRRIKKLKEAGYNAVRSSHNPCAEEMLKACDYYGIFVLDELWDTWYMHKNPYDYADDFMDNYEEDVKAMVQKDFNHPSVIMYSIGNELSEPVFEKGQEMTRKLVLLLHKLDGGRPVTAGYNLMIMTQAASGKSIYGGDENPAEKFMPQINSSLMFNMIAAGVGSNMNDSANSEEADRIVSPALELVDIAGYNYASGRYPLEGKCHPERVIFGSETFPQDIAKNWKMVEEYPYLIGDFMWTAWDYLGEAGGGAWGYTEDSLGFQKPYPWLLADMGAMDILGNPNGELFWAQAVWHLLKNPEITVQPVNHPGIIPAKSTWRGTNGLPSWSWKGCEGNEAVVEVFYDAAKIVLLCNEQVIGEAAPENCRAEFHLNYAAGKLEAIAYDSCGEEIGRNHLISSQGEIRTVVEPEEEKVCVGDILYVNIKRIGENGVAESNADVELSITVDGGRLLGFGSANPRTEESFVDGHYRTYYGYAQAVIEVGETDAVMIKVSDETTQIIKRQDVCPKS